jgi:hypothetical protein
LAMATLALVALAGRCHFQAVVTREVIKLYSGPARRIGPRGLAARRESLPDPVRGYLRFAIPEGAPAIGTVRLKHGGFSEPIPTGGGSAYMASSISLWHIPASCGVQESGQHPCCGSKPATASSLAGETCL